MPQLWQRLCQDLFPLFLDRPLSPPPLPSITPSHGPVHISFTSRSLPSLPPEMTNRLTSIQILVSREAVHLPDQSVTALLVAAPQSINFFLV
jgi:hypothetical protein